jgi:hypothetical protein
MQRLDAAPCPEVENAANPSVDHQTGKRVRSATDTEDVLWRNRVSKRKFSEVRRDPPARRTEGIREFVRSQIQQWSNLAI